MGAILAALAIVGCRPPEPPQFQRSPQLQSLMEFAEDDEGRNLWESLQTEIESQLARQVGTPMSPIVFGDPEADRARLRRGAEVYAYR